MRVLIFIFLFLITTCMVFCQQPVKHAAFSLMLKGLYKNTIPILPADSNTLKAIQANKYTLLDARESEEYAVSCLPGATWVGYDHFPATTLPADKTKPVLVYCTVGYRSERIGEKLKALGYTTVYNLYGGIVEWSNNSLPVVTPQGKATEKVHTYNKDWKRWLTKGEAVY